VQHGCEQHLAIEVLTEDSPLGLGSVCHCLQTVPLPFTWGDVGTSCPVVTRAICTRTISSFASRWIALMLTGKGCKHFFPTCLTHVWTCHLLVITRLSRSGWTKHGCSTNTSLTHLLKCTVLAMLGSSLVSLIINFKQHSSREILSSNKHKLTLTNSTNHDSPTPSQST
jgi:hypothetical protein